MRWTKHGRPAQTAIARGRRVVDALLFLAACAVPIACAAQWKPDKPVEIIVGVAPGGALDITAREIQRILQNGRVMPVPAAVVNRPGAGSAVAWTYMNQHAGNGHFIAISAPNLLTNALSGGNPLTYTDVTPLAQLFSEYIAFSVKADSSVRNAGELLARMRAEPGAFSIGIASARGATNHIAAGVVMKAAGVDLRKLKFVVFKSSAESMTALLGGHIDLDVATVSNVLAPLAAGTVRVLGVTAPKRLGGEFAQSPTWKENGIDTEFAGWRGVIGPAGLKRQQIAYWDEVLAKLAGMEEWKRGLEKNHWVGTYMNSDASAKFLRAQYDELKLVLGDLGLAR